MPRNYVITIELVDAVVGPFKARRTADALASELVEHGFKGVRVRPVLSGADVRWDWQYQQGGQIRWPT